MTLTDAGPLVALLDADEADHERCRAALEVLRLPLRTTWPAFTEAMYLIGLAGGWTGQKALWRLVLRGDLVIAPPPTNTTERAAVLMEKYADRPIAPEHLGRILEAGRRSPSSMNEQRWDFVLVTGRDRLKRLAEVWRYGKHVASSAATVALVTPWADDADARESIARAFRGISSGSRLTKKTTAPSARKTRPNRTRALR